MVGNSTQRCFQNFWCPMVTMLWWERTEERRGQGCHKEQVPGSHVTLTRPLDRGETHPHTYSFTCKQTFTCKEPFLFGMVLIFTEFFQECNYCRERRLYLKLCLELYKVLFTISCHSIDQYNILISICICSCHIYGDAMYE